MLLSNLNLLATAPSGVARLRELILTLAVQGKLVPQDPSDEPASELLKKIRAEKDRLMAEGKIKRDKSLPLITEDEKPFQLPSGWEWVLLGALMPFRIGKTPPSKDPQYWGDEGYAWVSISDMSHFGEVFDTNRKITARGAGVFGYEPLPVGTLIMSFKLTIGKIAVLRVPAYHNEAIVSLTPLAGLQTEFLKYMLPTVSKTGASKDALMGATLNTESLSNLLIALPPEAEQSRIVTRVEELMGLCDALEAKGQLEEAQHAQLVSTLLATLTENETPEQAAESWQCVATHFDLLLDRPEAIDALEQTILQLAVRGLLVPQNPQDEPASHLLKKIRAEKDQLITEGKIKRDKPFSPIAGDEMPFELPRGWEWVRIEEVAEVQGGIQKTPARQPINQHVPYLRVANVQRDMLRLTQIERFEITEDELARWRLASGDLLIVEGNGSADEIGRCALWAGEIDPCVYQNHLIRVRFFQPSTVSFSKLFLNAPSGAAEMKRLAITTSGLFSLSVGKIRNFVIPLPPLAEQSRIVSRVTELRQLCARLRERLAQAQGTQQVLAQALVSQA
jgi:type I restriction enzyme, S subunit